MPISLEALRDNQKEVRVRIGGDSIMVNIYPDRLTNDVMDRYREASEDEPRDYDAMAAAFGEFVASWDFKAKEGDKEPMPIDGKTFRFLPVRIINHIWAELVEAVTPKSAKKSGR